MTTARDETVNTGEGALRVVTIIYASGICILAAISNLIVGPWAYSSVGEKNTPLQVSVICAVRRTECRVRALGLAAVLVCILAFGWSLRVSLPTTFARRAPA